MSSSDQRIPRRGRRSAVTAALATLASGLAIVVASATPAAAAPSATPLFDSGPPGSEVSFTVDATDCVGPVTAGDPPVTIDGSDTPAHGSVTVDVANRRLKTTLASPTSDVRVHLTCPTMQPVEPPPDEEDAPTEEEVDTPFSFVFDIQGSPPADYEFAPEGGGDRVIPGKVLGIQPPRCPSNTDSRLHPAFHWSIDPPANATTPPAFLGAQLDSPPVESDDGGRFGPIAMNPVPEPPNGAEYLVAHFRCTNQQGDPYFSFAYGYQAIALEEPPPDSENTPTVPRNVGANSANSALVVLWDPPESNGGAELAGYQAQATGGRTCTANASQDSCRIDGLVNGRPYQVRVRARNVNGFGPWSDWSLRYRPYPVPLPDNGFVDVPEGAYYEQAVDWAKLFGITTGVSPDRYGPFESLLRKQIVTFLWRFADAPAGGGYPHHAFADVPGGTYYDDALRWAKATGVTTGISPQFFAPDQTVTRAQMVTFAWRAAGAKNVGAAHGMVDVPGGTYYDPAVRWAKAYGITTGVGGSNRFEPNRQVNRAEALTFLFRLAVTPDAWVNAGTAPSTVLF